MLVILCRGCFCLYRGFIIKYFLFNKDVCVICGIYVVKGCFLGDVYFCIRYFFG